MSFLRIAVLIDLPRGAAAGGHVKYWERLAYAAVKEDAPVDLTLYFSGNGPDEILSPNVRFRFLPPVFSTERLKFLPYVPAHTDLAPFHPRLARELPDYDVIHTTDGFFAFARTAERLAAWNDIPLVSSFHTDTLSYAELFTRQTLRSLLGDRVGGWVDRVFKLSARERASKERRLKKHLRACTSILAMRPEDFALATEAAPQIPIKAMHHGVDKVLFAPQAQARLEIEKTLLLGPGKFLVLFVGRVDAGKNMPVLLQACVDTLEQGIPLHLIVAGQGPMSDEVKAKLGENVTLAGTVEPSKLAQFYAAVDCLAMASTIEIGGMIALEALASGCPVLVSRESGVAQLCGDPAAMVKIENTSGAWAEAMVCLARHSDQQNAMHEAALAFRRDSLAGWNDVLNADFIPIWQRAARKQSYDVRKAYSYSGGTSR